MSRLSDDLLRCARSRVAEPTRCREADLRRATSDLYYALFHRVCEAIVEPLVLDPASPIFKSAYEGLYRSPDHATLEKRCKHVASTKEDFSDATRRFAKQLASLKNKREIADYNPLAQIKISAVRNDLTTVESVLEEFGKLGALERLKFAMFVGIAGRK